MLKLNQVTLFCVDTRTPDLSIWAMQQCLQKAHFKEAILVTDTTQIIHTPDYIRIIEAPPIFSIEDYSTYLQSDLSSYIQGTHMLVMQWDSFIVNPHLWTDQFLEYDYIGAPWPHHPDNPVGVVFPYDQKKYLQHNKILCIKNHILKIRVFVSLIKMY